MHGLASGLFITFGHPNSDVTFNQDVRMQRYLFGPFCGHQRLNIATKRRQGTIMLVKEKKRQIRRKPRKQSNTVFLPANREVPTEG